jgi:hypothetical protein
MFSVILIELRFQECSVSPEILIDSKDLSKVKENQPSINGGHSILRRRAYFKKHSGSIKRLKILEVLFVFSVSLEILQALSNLP